MSKENPDDRFLSETKLEVLRSRKYDRLTIRCWISHRFDPLYCWQLMRFEEKLAVKNNLVPLKLRGVKQRREFSSFHKNQRLVKEASSTMLQSGCFE